MPERICSAMEESCILFLLRSLLKFMGKVTRDRVDRKRVKGRAEEDKGGGHNNILILIITTADFTIALAQQKYLQNTRIT